MRAVPNGLQFPPGFAGAATPQPVVQLAQPVNDAQIVALIATQFQALSPIMAVRKAIDIIAEACAHGPMLAQRIKEAQANFQARHDAGT